MRENQIAAPARYQMTSDDIAAFLDAQKNHGASADCFRQRKGFVNSLYQWLPEDKALSKERLQLWREDMEKKGYTRQTILNYVKGINLYLDYMGWSELRFNRGKAKDLRNLTFGYLIPIAPTEERNRRDIVWSCKCRCGNLVELPATRLLAGNTLSCGCRKAENIRTVSKSIAGTHLVQALKEDERKSNTLSGYTGVAPKRGGWYAHITYRGKRYNLGTYSNMEEAVKARARAKELVMEDAQKLLACFEELHRNDEKLDRSALPRVKHEPMLPEREGLVCPSVTRSNNTSGYPGVSRARQKWRASISYQGKRYLLGSFREVEDAIAARMDAEKKLNEDPQAFVTEQGRKKELCV